MHVYPSPQLHRLSMLSGGCFKRTPLAASCGCMKHCHYLLTGKRGMIDPTQRSKANEEQQHGMYMGRVSKNNPLGRVSVSRPSPAQLERASVARVGPPPPGQRNSIGRNSLGRTSLGRTSAGRTGAAKGSTT